MARKPRPWFRFYVEAVHDRKLRRLKPEQRWLFVACLAAARQSCLPGFLLVSERDSMTVDDLADLAAMPAKAVAEGMAALERSGMIERDENIRAWCVTNWNDRQFESDDVTNRTRAHRERSKEPDRNVPTLSDGTPPENREQKTDTDVIGSYPQFRMEFGPGWRPTQASVDWAYVSGYTEFQIKRQTGRFVASNQTKRTQFRDVELAWRAWMRQETPEAVVIEMPTLRASNPCGLCGAGLQPGLDGELECSAGCEAIVIDLAVSS